MITVHYANQPAAVVDGGAIYLSSRIATFEHDHPRRRFVECMCAHADDVASQGADGPYSDEHAERHARSALLPDETFARHDWLPDANLAEIFNVPLEQIGQKRRELRDPDRGGALVRCRETGAFRRARSR